MKKKTNHSYMLPSIYHNKDQTHRTVPYHLQLVASAALYLKLARTIGNHVDQKELVKRIVGCQRREEHAGVELLMGGRRDARDLVVMKPVHLRLRLECGDHPAGATNKETISTESSLKINVSLD